MYSVQYYYYDYIVYGIMCILQREAQTKEKVQTIKCEKRLAVRFYRWFLRITVHLFVCLFCLSVCLFACGCVVKLTRAAGDWLPRLERMVDSRKLCSFERSVLLALIGSIIQPNKFNAGETVIAKNCAHVGDLLQLFCPSLEDQIQHRKYFYKSAILIREGMVVVHNAGLTGDPSSATVSLSG